MSWTTPVNGHAEIVGLDHPDLLAEFSQRRDAIIEAAGAAASADARQAAAPAVADDWVIAPA
ncbi:MAG: hypothetical protein ACRDZQ_14155, partial [Acidimicrobiales bacterium]